MSEATTPVEGSGVTPSWCESNGWVNHGDGTTWPDPADPREVEWKLRYGTPERADLLWAASVIGAYRHLMEGVT